MGIDVVDVNVQILRCLAQPLRVFVFRSRVAHHDDVIAQLHGRMIDLAVGPTMRGAVLLKAKCLREKLQRSIDIFVQEIWCDCHV
jgi:hypothetical protein